MHDLPNPSAAVTIRRAGPADASVLSELAEATFRETWLEDHAMPYTAADVASFLPGYAGEAAWAATLADPGAAVWLAERAGAAVGFAYAGACTLPYPEVTPACGELKRLYVRRSERGTGLGGRLFEAAERWLERDGPRPIWIGVWSGNTGAQRLYARHGFVKVGEHTYRVGATVDQEFALRRG